MIRALATRLLPRPLALALALARPGPTFGMTTQDAYDAVIGEARSLMLAKSHDYDEAWREMRLPSITDQLLVKVRRIRRLEELAAQGKGPTVSEGIASEYRDILNYAVFGLILLSEKESDHVL